MNVQHLDMKQECPAIAAVIKVSLEGHPTLVGTGFFITRQGLFVTAKHVILDNVGEQGTDTGGIGALLLDRRNFGQYLPLAWTSWHPVSDIAVSDIRTRYQVDGTPVETETLPLSVRELPIGATIASRFFCHADRDVSDKDIVLPNPQRIILTYKLEHAFCSGGPATPETSAGILTSAYGSQNRNGELRQHYRPMRDKVMLPFPVFESDLAIPGSGSGGPVFNDQGMVIGINCTGIPGSDISYHTYISELLDLWVRVQGSRAETPRVARLRELAKHGILSINGLV